MQTEQATKGDEQGVSAIGGPEAILAVRNEQLMDQIRRLSFELEQKRNENELLRTRRPDEAKVVSVESLLSVQAKLGACQNELLALKFEYQLASEEKQTLEQIINDQISQLSEISRLQAESQLSFKKSQFENESLLKQYSQQSRELSLYQSELVKEKSERKSAEEQLELLTQHGSLLGEQVSTLQAQKLQLSEQLQACLGKEGEDLESLKKVNNQLQIQVSELEIEKDSLNEKVRSMEEENEELRKVVNSRNDVAEKNQESLLKTINELDQKNNELLGDNVKLKEKMKHLNEELLQYQTSRRVGYSSQNSFSQQKSVESQEKFLSIGYSDTRDENATDAARVLKELIEKNTFISKLKEQLNQCKIENDSLKIDSQLKDKELADLRSLFQSPNDADQSSNQEVSSLHQYIKGLQLQLQEKDQQLKDQLALVQHVIKNELQEELYQIRSEQMFMQKQYEVQIQKLTDELAQNQDNFDSFVKRAEEEKHQLKNVRKPKYEEPDSWKDQVLRYKSSHQNDLLDMKRQLDSLKKSLVNFPEIEINAERKAYEATILQLNNRVRELEAADDGQFQSSEMLQQELINLNDEIFRLRNDKQYLEIKINQQAAFIENLQEQLTANSQQIDHFRRQKEEMNNVLKISLFNLFKVHQERIVLDRLAITKNLLPLTAISTSSQQRTPNESLEFIQHPLQPQCQSKLQFKYLLSTRDVEELHLRDAEELYHKLGLYDQEQYKLRYVKHLFSNHCRNSEIINKKQEINSKLNEIEDVKRKYQRALNNIQKLEEQVMDKLQKEEVIIE